MNLDNLNKLEDKIITCPLNTKDKAELLNLIRYIRIDVEEYTSKSVSWNVLDFKGRAEYFEKEFPEKNYRFDVDKFEEVLTKMIKDHDATIGITWETIDSYLMQYCLKGFELDDYESKLH